MYVVNNHLNNVVNYSDAKKSAHYSHVLIVTELVVSGTQCINNLCDLQLIRGHGEQKRYKIKN